MPSHPQKKGADFLRKEANSENLIFSKTPNQTQLKSPSPSVFGNLKQFVFKLFLNRPFSVEDLLPDKYEKLILGFILRKKKFQRRLTEPMDLRFFQKVVDWVPKKKKEAKLKFVFSKCFSHLKKEFLTHATKQEATGKTHKHPIEEEPLDLGYRFYHFHFGELAEATRTPIEKFFLFRNWTHRFDENLPKTITSDLIRRWKACPLFVNRLKDYIRQGFLEDVRLKNERKIEAMFKKWGDWARRLGFEPAVSRIVSELDSRSSKLPWTLGEVREALQVALDTLR